MLQSTYPAYAHLDFVTVPQILRWIHTVPHSRGCPRSENASSLDGRALTAVGNELWHGEDHVLCAAILAEYGFPVDAGLEGERMRIFDELYILQVRHCQIMV